MSIEHIEPATLPQASAFYEQGKEQLRHLVKGEDRATDAVLLAMASGLDVVLFGVPAGGKTTLSLNHAKLAGVTEEQLAVIDADADLTVQKLTGGVTTVDKTRIPFGGEESEGVKERISTEVQDPIIREMTKVIIANEINRTNQVTLNKSLEIFEAGRVFRNGRRIDLDLGWIVSNMNPSEKKESTFPISAAMASRHTLGVEMGTEDEETDEDLNEIFNGWVPKPDLVQPITTLEGLKAIKALVTNRESTSATDEATKEARELVKRATAQLKEARIVDEGRKRMLSRAGVIARTLAVFNSRDVANIYDAREAVRLAVDGRLGMLNARPDVANHLRTVIFE